LPATRRARVAIVQRALRKYRAGFFDALREDLASDGIDLLLFHSTLQAPEDSREDALEVPWAQHLERRIVRVGGRHLVWQPFVRDLRTADLVIVEQAAQLALNYRLLARQTLGGPLVAFWGHGRSFATDLSAVGERAKASASTRAHWWFAHTSLSAEVVADLGFERDRITVVDNAIDTTALRHELANVAESQLLGLRRELGVGLGPVGLFLGNLREEKRLDVLFAACDRIRAAVPGFQLAVVGHGSEAGRVAAAARERSWLHDLGPRFGADRARVLALADLLLLPASVGLVVLDSFAAEAPLVTSVAAGHGPEIAYIRAGENGVLVEGGTDPDRYARAVIAVLNDRETLERLRAGCAADAGRYSIEAMTAQFADGVRSALATPRRRRHL
jgi:glycosyltransferase involved in cell wall biosynthesis